MAENWIFSVTSVEISSVKI